MRSLRRITRIAYERLLAPLGSRAVEEMLSDGLPPRLAPALRFLFTGEAAAAAENAALRIEQLRAANVAMRFLSVEPLLEDLGRLDLSGIDWVIVGGESGPGARPLHRDWVLSIRNQCCKARVPFFFKQWAGVHKSKNGRKLDGRTYGQMPAAFSLAAQFGT